MRSQAGYSASELMTVVEEPFGAHPSYAQGFYDRDQDFYLEWDDIAREPQRLAAYLQEWVHDLPDRATYLDRLGPDRLRRLRPQPAPSDPVDYGRYPGPGAAATGTSGGRGA